MKAFIKTVSRGKQQGRFRFVLKTSNNEVIATSGTQSYASKQMCKQTLIDCFPQFEIVDLVERKERTKN